MRGSTLFNGSLIRSHIWGTDLSGSSQGAGGVGGLLVSRIGGADYYPLYDGNGNVTEYRNASSTVAHFQYDAFGAVSSFTCPMWDFNLRFSTKYEDFEAGLNYYGYRYYDPQLGRWLNRDPIEEKGGNNLYGFVGNNGLTYWDKLCLEACKEPKIKDPNKMEQCMQSYIDCMSDLPGISNALVGVSSGAVLGALSMGLYTGAGSNPISWGAAGVGALYGGIASLVSHVDSRNSGADRCDRALQRCVERVPCVCSQ